MNLTETPNANGIVAFDGIRIKEEPLDCIATSSSTDNSAFQYGGLPIKQEPSDSFVVLAGTSDIDPNDNGSVKPKQTKKRKDASQGDTKQVKVKKEIKKEVKQETLDGKVKRKRDRFPGSSEEEVLMKVLPDHLDHNLDIIIIGINPGLCAAYVGHHYAGPGNHFWKCLFLSGLIPHQMNCYDDRTLLQYGIGFTNIVERTSRGSADLTRKEIAEGGQILKEKIQKFKPRIAVFNGKGIYEVFVGHKKFHIGKQPDPFPDCPNTAVFVMPSSSARFTQLPRAIDKVPFYVALKRYRDYIKGQGPAMQDDELYFPDLDLKVKPKVKPEVDAGANEESKAKETKPVVKRGRKKKDDASNENKESKPKRVRKKKNETQPKSTNDCESASKPAAMNLSQDVPVTSAPSNGCTDDPSTGINGNHVQANDGSSHLPKDIQAVFSGESNLVKQEDVSELAAYGINPSMPPSAYYQGFLDPRTTNHSIPPVTTSGSAYMSQYSYHLPPSTQGFPGNSFMTPAGQSFYPGIHRPIPRMPANASRISPDSQQTDSNNKSVE